MPVDQIYAYTKSILSDLLKNFLSNIAKNLKLREYKNLSSNIENIKDLVFRVILKHKTTQVSLQ